MQVLTFETERQWLDNRPGRILGSTLNDVYAPRGGRKIGFYQLVADRLAIVEDSDEAARDRGHRLETEAIEAFNTDHKLKLIPCENTIWASDDNPNIAVSPDGHNKALTIGAEVKCLKAALHLQAVIEGKVTSASYRLQALQYFIVNEKLKKLYFIFYNPNVTSWPLYVIEMKRQDFEEDIQFYKEYELNTLAEIDALVERLAF